MKFDAYDTYIERLLEAQYQASEIIEHDLTRGECREHFLRSLVESEFPSLQALKGVLSGRSKQYGQCDCAILPKSCRCRTLGNQNLINPEDARLIVEIKSTITHSDLIKINKLGRRLSIDFAESYPLVGIFGYRISVLQDNFLKKFGFSIIRTHPEENLCVTIYAPDQIENLFPYVDFVISLHEVKTSEDNIQMTDKRKFFLRHDRISGQVLMPAENPVVKHLFQLIESVSRGG